MDREVKTEMLSPQPFSTPRRSNDSDEDEPSRSQSTKKLDPVDKWRARVLFCRPRQADGDEGEESLHKRIEKQAAVLRVAFPFLTERQIQGKAWQSCGLTSIMGGVPRNGLSPKVKREFTKHRGSNKCTMSRSKVRKESIKTEKDDKKLKRCPYTFASPNGQLLTPMSILENINAKNSLHLDPFSDSQQEDSTQISNDQLLTPRISNDQLLTPMGVFENLKAKNSMLINPFSDSQQQDSTQISGIGVLSASSNGSTKKRKRQTKKSQKVNFDLPLSPESNQVIIPETPDPSVRSTSPFCSQPLLKPQDLVGLNTIIPSLAAGSNCYTQAHISECSTTAQSNTGQTMSGFDKGMECSRSSQVVNPFSKTVMQEAHLPSSPNSQHPNTEKSLISHEEIDKTQTDTDPTLSGLNKASGTCETTDAILTNNNFCTAKTPIRNTKIGDVKKKIIFETVAEVYCSDSFLPEKENHSNLANMTDQDLREEDTTKVESHVGTATNSLLCTPKNVQYTKHVQEIVIEESSYTTNFSMNEPMDINHTIQNLDEQSAMTPLNEKSPLNTNPTRLTDVSLHISSNNETQNAEFYQNYLQGSFMKYQSEINNDDEQYFTSLPKELNLCVSLPLTPHNGIEYIMPDSVMMSNYCSEHDKAYTKKDLKPASCRNYYSDKINEPLKNDFDQVIPPDESMPTFFEAPEKSFKRVQTQVRRAVNNILQRLEEDESGESY